MKNNNVYGYMKNDLPTGHYTTSQSAIFVCKKVLKQLLKQKSASTVLDVIIFNYDTHKKYYYRCYCIKYDEPKTLVFNHKVIKQYWEKKITKILPALIEPNNMNY